VVQMENIVAEDLRIRSRGAGGGGEHIGDRTD
jgi:hypothetical protein